MNVSYELRQFKLYWDHFKNSSFCVNSHHRGPEMNLFTAVQGLYEAVTTQAVYLNAPAISAEYKKPRSDSGGSEWGEQRHMHGLISDELIQWGGKANELVSNNLQLK